MNKDSIKIKLIFNGKNLTVDVPKNKPFKILREKVHAFFYPLPQNYSFFEKKEDLSTVEDKLLGDIFGARNLIILTLKEINSNTKLVNSQKKFCKECTTESQGTNEISYYCRDCNSFICKSCRLNSESGKHYEHSIVQLFEINGYGTLYNLKYGKKKNNVELPQLMKAFMKNGMAKNYNLYSKDIIFSKVVLQAYKEVLKELYGVQLSRNEIREILKNFFKMHSIFFVYMNIDYYGLIIYDGTILINQIYLGAKSNRNSLIILFTLMNEIMHALSRMARGDDNFLLNTDKFTKNTIISAKESGNYFENKLLFSALKAKELTSIEAGFFLETSNYGHETIDDFHKAFIDFRNKNANIINSAPTFSVGKENNNDSFTYNFGCYCAGSRSNY